MNLEKFEKDMDVFGLKHHQDFLTYFKMLMRSGYSIDDVENYVENKKAEMNVPAESKRGPQIKCPDCGSRILILPVNDKPSTRTGDNSRSVMMCHNKECMYTEYSPKTVGEIIQSMDFSKT